MELLTNGYFVLALSLYAIGVASPGPSNLAIISVALNSGRQAALVFSAGVMLGSLFWGLLTAFGLATLLLAYADLLYVIKVVGGCYLLWLAWKSMKSALATGPMAMPVDRRQESSHLRNLLSGATLHLMNPKAIVVWVTIISVAIPSAATYRDTLAVVLSCAALGVLIFGGYALAFSTPLAGRIYSRVKRGLDSVLAMLFGYAGMKMILEKGTV